MVSAHSGWWLLTMSALSLSNDRRTTIKASQHTKETLVNDHYAANDVKWSAYKLQRICADDVRWAMRVKDLQAHDVLWSMKNQFSTIHCKRSMHTDTFKHTNTSTAYILFCFYCYVVLLVLLVCGYSALLFTDIVSVSNRSLSSSLG